MTMFTDTLPNGNTWIVEVCTPTYVEVFVGTPGQQAQRLTFSDYADADATSDIVDDASALQEFWNSVAPMLDADAMEQSPENAPRLALCFPPEVAAQITAWHAQHEDEDRDEGPDPALLKAAANYADAMIR